MTAKRKKVAAVFAALFVAYGVMAAALYWPEDAAPKPVTTAAASPLPTPTPQKPERLLRGEGTPTRLEIPSLDVVAPIEQIEVRPDGDLAPPSDPDDVGWWVRSARVGSASGQTVITGHTVSSGDGALDYIGDLERGDTIKVVTPEGVATYRTVRTQVYSKAEVAQNNVEIFGQARNRPRLTLITCTDYNGSTYESNLIVYAVPVADARVT